jgi:rubrerythrin
MGSRLLPRDLHELYAHALALERAAAKRFVELERYMRDAGINHIADELRSIGQEEREQYELLAVGIGERNLPKLSGVGVRRPGPQADAERAPRNVRDALALALAIERRMQNFYVDVAEHTADDAMCAFAGKMAVDEGGRRVAA